MTTYSESLKRGYEKITGVDGVCVYVLWLVRCLPLESARK